MNHSIRNYICNRNFFLSEGLRPSDVDAIRDYIIAVAMRTHTGMDFLYSIPLDELMAIITSLAKSAKAQKG